MIRFRSLALAFLVLLVAGCATGPAYKDVAGTFPPVASSNGRIYFYRTAMMGAAVQPQVKLNGDVVGKAVPGGFFYVDRPAGDYTVVTETELKKTLTFHLDAGQVRYVRLDLSMGVFVGHVYGELVDPTEAQPQLATTKWDSKPQA